MLKNKKPNYTDVIRLTITIISLNYSSYPKFLSMSYSAIPYNQSSGLIPVLEHF